VHRAARLQGSGLTFNPAYTNWPLHINYGTTFHTSWNSRVTLSASCETMPRSSEPSGVCWPRHADVPSESSESLLGRSDSSSGFARNRACSSVRSCVMLATFLLASDLLSPDTLTSASFFFSCPRDIESICWRFSAAVAASMACLKAFCRTASCLKASAKRVVCFSSSAICRSSSFWCFCCMHPPVSTYADRL